MSELPTGWIATTLENLVQLKTGPFGSSLHRSDYVPNQIPLINPSHIVDGKLVPDPEITVEPEVCDRLSECLLRSGDVVMGRRGEMGRCAVVPSTSAGWMCGTGSLILRSNNAIWPDFLQRLLTSPETVSRLNSASVGSTMVNLNQRVLLELPALLPPLPEQQRIADKLDKLLTRIDACRDRLNHVGVLLKRFRQLVMRSGASGKLTVEQRAAKRWQEPSSVRLGDILRVSSGSALTAKNMVAGGSVPVYGGNGVNGHHDVGNVKGRTLLIGRVGFYCGSVHLTPDNAWVTDNALIVRHDRDVVDLDFLRIALQATDLRGDHSSTAQPLVTGQRIYPIAVLLPSLEEQREIVRQVERVLVLAARLEVRLAAALKQTDRLTPAVLAKAFRGELVPQDPADESAEVMLKRLRLEEATVASARRRRRPATA